MFAAILDHASKTGLLAGFLAQKEQFGSLETILHPQPELKVWANCDQIDLLPGANLESDWLAWHYFEMTTPQPFEAYLKLVARETRSDPRMKTPVGWCSWYYYFQNITPQILQNNLESVHAVKETLPLDFSRSMMAINRTLAAGSSSTRSFRMASRLWCRKFAKSFYPPWHLAGAFYPRTQI